MAVLVTGLISFFALHILPTTWRSLRTELILKLSKTGYRLLFSLLVIMSVYAIVVGWQNTTPFFLYDAGDWARALMVLIMPIPFILLFCGILPTKLQQMIAAPHVDAILFWSGFHAIISGDSRGLLVFGAFFIWAFTIRRAMKRRYEKKPGHIKWDLAAVALGMTVYVGFLHGHSLLFGVSPMASITSLLNTG